MNLTKRQVTMMMDASVEFNKMVSKESKKTVPVEKGSKDGKINDALALFGMAGVKMTDKAKKALRKAKMKNV